MNIDTIINQPNIYNKLSIENPSYDIIFNELGEHENETLNGIEYRVNKIVDIMDESNSFTRDDGTTYVLVDFNKEMADVITSIKCNYQFGIVLKNTKHMPYSPSTDLFIKTLIEKFPRFKELLLEPIDIYSNTIPITLPILFMINTNIKFKIFFKDIDEYANSNIRIEYTCYTFSNHYLKILNSEYKKNRYICNMRGMIIEDGILRHDFDLD